MSLIPQVFQFEAHVIRAVLVQDEPWFTAADICAALQLTNPRSSLALLDEDEKGVHTMDTPGGRQELVVVNEPGMYSLILRSRKPEAKRFKRWITHDVIPTIRKTGQYGAPTKPGSDLKPRDLALMVIAEADRADAAEAIAQQRAKDLEAAAPLVAQAEHYRAASGLTAVATFANDLATWADENHKVAILHAEVRDFMAELGLLIRGNTIRNNEPTADAQKRGLMRIKHTTYDTNTRGVQSKASARLTPKDCGYVWDRALERIAATGSLAPPTKAIEGEVA